MRTKQFSGIVIAAAVVVGASLTAAGQQQTPQIAASQKQEAKSTPAKSARVWTDDDVLSLRSPAGIFGEQKEAQASEAAVPKQTVPLKPAQVAAPPALSNPETVEDANKMIAWENRDAEAQQQFVEQLRKELDQAPPDQKERLQTLLQQHIQGLADTRKEMEDLKAKEKELEKKPVAGNSTTTSLPSPQ